MTKVIDDQSILRYNRQIVLPQIDLDGQEALMNASVLLVGVGGLGCACAQYLIASGIGEVTLVDDDLVDLNNLQRQVLHTENNVGRPKVDSAFEALSALNSHATINRINQRLNDEQLSKQISNHTIVIDCSDNLSTRNQLNRLCWQRKTALISGAAIRMEGQLMVIDPAFGGPCYACFSRLFGEQNLSCSETGILSPVVGVVGASQAVLALKQILKLGVSAVGTLYLYDAIEFSWRQLKVPTDPHCAVCGSSRTD